MKTALHEMVIPERIAVKTGKGGMRYLELRFDGAVAHLYLHGAHVLHYQPAGQAPVLWHSKDSWFEPGKPIRGGIPVCWPWFGAHPEDPEQPSHDVCTVIDPAQKRSIEIHKENSRSTVVWNPWQEKAARMPDFGKDEFTGMVCVETANCGPDPVTLPPGQAHALHLQIRAQNQLNHPLSPDDYRFSL